MVAFADLTPDLGPGAGRADAREITHDVHVAIRRALWPYLLTASRQGRRSEVLRWSGVRCGVIVFCSGGDVGVEGWSAGFCPFVYGPVVRRLGRRVGGSRVMEGGRGRGGGGGRWREFDELLRWVG